MGEPDGHRSSRLLWSLPNWLSFRPTKMLKHQSDREWQLLIKGEVLLQSFTEAFDELADFSRHHVSLRDPCRPTQ
jgi:hypothetical protein